MAQKEVHYHCPSCGAPQRDAGRGACDYCSAPRVPMGTPDPSTAIRCGGCHTLVGARASFCLHCGHALASFDSALTQFGCPHCKDDAQHMTRWGISPTAEQPSGFEIDGCTHCGGVWIQQATLDAMLQEAAKISALREVDEKRVKRRVVADLIAKFEYRRCPICTEQMARQNFERVSGVILDCCPEHGTFFDAGELEDTLEFVRSGGLVMAQRKKNIENERMARKEAAIRSQTIPRSSMGMGMVSSGGQVDLYGAGSGLLDNGDFVVGDLALAFLRWSVGWTRKVGKRVWLGLKSPNDR